VKVNPGILHQLGQIADGVASLRMAYEVYRVLVAPLPLVKLFQISICDGWLVVLRPPILIQLRIVLSIVNFD
jgi:hypothetical protein